MIANKDLKKDEAIFNVLREYIKQSKDILFEGNGYSQEWEDEAKKRGLEPLGFLRDYAYAGLDPKRMGLGPVFATHKLFEQTGLGMDDIEIVEINEAFAAQVIACEKAFASEAFAKAHFGESKAVGAIDPEILNVNGGAVALGHPVGMTGTRLVLTVLHELRLRKLQRGLATLCIGGGQGAALLLEVK